MISALDFAKCALDPKWNKYKYSELDCQAFVEEVLKDSGVRKKNGSCYNWKGSNSMYRNYFTWRGTIEECYKKFGYVPIGSFVYVWKETGEPAEYVNDGLGNCSHVGIYCGNNIVRDSTRSTKLKRDGVGNRTLEGFSRVSLCSALDYSRTNSYNASEERILSIIDNIHNLLIDLEGEIKNELFRG